MLSTDAEPKLSHHTNVGPIIGGVVGGVLGLGVIVALVIFFIRHKRSRYGTMTYDGERLSLDRPRDTMIYTTTPYTDGTFDPGDVS